MKALSPTCGFVKADESESSWYRSSISSAIGVHIAHVFRAAFVLTM